MRRSFGLLLLLAVLIGPVYALLAGSVVAVWPSLALSLVTLGVAGMSRWRETRGGKTTLALLLAAGVPIHYAATATVYQRLLVPLQDDALAAVDRGLLGWLWPEGQLSIWIDRSSWIGPTTPLGRVVSELLQVSYFSYYAWGYGLLFLLLVWHWKGRIAWRQVQAYLMAWVGAYLVNFALYLVVPAMGPWYAFGQWFQHRIDGLWLTRPIRDLIMENQVTPDCFPSGHTALSWIAAIVALRVAPRYGRVALVAAILITVATLALRYHYAIDVIAAVPLIALGLFWGGYHRSRSSPA